MNEEKIDLRVIKTKRNIYQALLSLMKDHIFEDIKVSQICDKAMINRSTFYAHFDDKYSLFKSFIEDLESTLKVELSKNKNILSSKEYYIELIRLLITHFEKERDVYTALIQNNRNSIAMDMIHDALREDVFSHVKKEELVGKKIPIEFTLNFYLGAIFYVGMEWITNNEKYTKEEIIEYLNLLIPNEVI